MSDFAQCPSGRLPRLARALQRGRGVPRPPSVVRLVAGNPFRQPDSLFNGAVMTLVTAPSSDVDLRRRQSREERRGSISQFPGRSEFIRPLSLVQPRAGMNERTVGKGREREKDGIRLWEPRAI